jgi:hypothetical protein
MADKATVPMVLNAELARVFARACEQLGRDPDDVFCEMLDLFLAKRGIAGVVAGDGPLSPPPGPIDDPTQPHAQPFCHNAHQHLRDRRMAARLARIENLLLAQQLVAPSLQGPRPSHPRSRDEVEQARDHRAAIAGAIQRMRANRH